MDLQMLLYVIGLILLLLAAFRVEPPYLSLGWFGLALWLFAAAILPEL